MDGGGNRPAAAGPAAAGCNWPPSSGATTSIWTCRRESGNETAVVVERAWVQTWLPSGSTPAPGPRRLPLHQQPPGTGGDAAAGAATDQISVLLDGKRWPAATRRRRPDRSRWPATAGSAGTCWNSLPRSPERPPRGAMSLEMPRLGSDVWVRRLYWQLVLPRDEHLLSARPLRRRINLGLGTASAGAASRCWTRRNWRDWSGCPQPAGAGRPSANGYLFSALRQRGPLQLRTAGRSWIVLAGLGGALLAGLLLIYFRRLRHPAACSSAAVVCWRRQRSSTRNRRCWRRRPRVLGLALALVAVLVRLRAAPAPAVPRAGQLDCHQPAGSLARGPAPGGGVPAAARRRRRSPPTLDRPSATATLPPAADIEP